MDDYSVNSIINEIELQRYYMRARYNIEPNKVILGRRVLGILETEYNRWSRPEYYTDLKNDRITATVVGLPVTVDCDNVYTIQVCFIPEEMMKRLDMLVR